MKTLKLFILLALFSLLLIKVYAQPVTLNQIRENTYVIQLKGNSSNNEYYWSNDPDSWKNAMKIDIHQNPDTLNLNSVHPIIKCTVDNQPFYCSQRLISLQGGINFRDLGGYINKEGKQVKWGKLFRSADISKLTDEDLKVITALHIILDCDLRGDPEVKAAPDKIPSGTVRISLPAGSENTGTGMGELMKYMKNENTADSMMLVFYTQTSHFQKKYKPMFDRLLTLGPDEAILFHCAAGKDRTGVGAALILFALGVDESIIYQDYELTNVYRQVSNDQYIKLLSTQGVSENAARIFMSADPKYLRATFDSLKKQYGSIDAFLESEMGLNQNDLHRLRSLYLY